MSKTFAQIENGIVINVLIAETLEDAQLVTNNSCIEYTLDNQAAIGWSYNAESNTFTAPVIEPPVEA